MYFKRTEKLGKFNIPTPFFEGYFYGLQDGYGEVAGDENDIKRAYKKYLEQQSKSTFAKFKENVKLIMIALVVAVVFVAAHYVHVKLDEVERTDDFWQQMDNIKKGSAPVGAKIS